jgi:ubiquinone/menaquinone biosynthesis C-methylase UbiE
MATMTTRTADAGRKKIFISYSRKDRPWLERLQVHLRPLDRFGIDRWDDSRLEGGDLWRSEIRRAIEAADVAVLLVSADFLASDFIEKEELPPLLAQAKRNKGTLILPVIVTSCLFSETKSLSEFMTVNPPSEPLEKLNDYERNEVWVRLARTILARLSEEAAVPAGTPDASAKPLPPADVAPAREAVPTAEESAAVPAAPPKPGVGGGRFALLVINDRFDIPVFSKLAARPAEMPDLEGILTSRDSGGFKVTTLRNEPCERVRREVRSFFANRDADDLLFLYFSGIGLKDADYRLSFATTDTQLPSDEPKSAIHSDILQVAMRRCRSRRQVVVLDCRYIGCYPPGAAAGDCDPPGLTAGFQGEGQFVLSSDERLCFAWEKGAPVETIDLGANDPPPLLISDLVHGLKSGKADLDGNRKVSVEELFRYLEESAKAKVPDVRLARWAFDQSKGEGVIIADFELPGEPEKPTALQDRDRVVQDTRQPILDLIAPTYILDKHFYFLDWNPAFDEIVAKPLKLVRGRDHARIFIQALANCEEVIRHARETFGGERQPLADTEILVFDSDQYGPVRYGTIRFQKVAAQITDERGEIRGWSVSLNILEAGDARRLWADIMSRIEEEVSWTRYAVVYDALLLRFPEYRDLVALVASKVGNARRCLDLGAGTGNGAIRLLESDPAREVWAVEINETMLRHFRAKIASSGVDYSDRLTILKDNLLRLDALPAKSFHGAVMINVLYAVGDRAECLRNVNRVLKPGGVLALSTPHRKTDVDRLFNRLREALEAQDLFDQYQEHFNAALARHVAMDELIHRDTLDDTARLLTEAGFTIEEMIPDQYVGSVAVIKAVKTGAPAPKSVLPLPPPAGRDVFISYAARDAADADTIRAFLEGRGINCWIAPRDVRGGMDYAAEITQAIRRSRVMILVLTPYANESEHTVREVALASLQRIPIIPFRATESVTPSDSLAYYLSNVHWLDAFPPPLENHLPRLAETVTALLSNIAGTTAEAQAT